MIEDREVKALTICYERPCTLDELSKIMGCTDTEAASLVDGLKEKGFLEEVEGKLKPTREGDYYISN